MSIAKYDTSKANPYADEHFPYEDSTFPIYDAKLNVSDDNNYMPTGMKSNLGFDINNVLQN